MNINLPIYNEENTHLFALGRNAMYAACKILDLQNGDEILTPAFDCDGSLQPFKALGCKLKFFKSDPYNFNVDIEDIRSKVSAKTKLIHIINHFGMPQLWNKLLALRKKLDIPILEDNAYSLFSKLDGKLFGTFGDFSIFSLRKNLPISEGGMLRINNSKYTFNLSNLNTRLFYPSQIFNSLKIIKTKLRIYRIPEIFKFFLTKFYPEIEPPPPLYSDSEKGFPAWPLRDKIGGDFSCDYLRTISPVALEQLNKFLAADYTDIINKKRQYYFLFAEKISNIDGITILWPDLAEGIAPFCLSILIGSNRDIFFDVLRKKYDVMAWPTLSELILNRLKEFPEVEILGRKLLQINLPANKVRHPKFRSYLDVLTEDIKELAQRYL